MKPQVAPQEALLCCALLGHDARCFTYHLSCVGTFQWSVDKTNIFLLVHDFLKGNECTCSPVPVCLTFPDSAQSSREGRWLPHNPLSYLLWLGFHLDGNAQGEWRESS